MSILADVDYRNIDHDALGSLEYQDLELKRTAEKRARERGAREDSNDKDCAMPLSVFRNLVQHARTHYPVEHWSPSNTMLQLMMLRITAVLSTPKKQVICVPERSWLMASAYASKPYLPEGLVHHMLIRADNGVARNILFDPVETLECIAQAWLKDIETAHIFEAKTRAGRNAAFPFVSTHLRHWCEVTGKAHARAALMYEYEWQFVIYHAPQRGRGACVQTLGARQLRIKPNEVDLILGLLLDMVENTSKLRSEYFKVVKAEYCMR